MASSWGRSSAPARRQPSGPGRLLGFYGVLTLGVGVLIVAGGIDLSIGSLVGLGAVCFGLLLQKQWSVFSAIAALIVGRMRR